MTNLQTFMSAVATVMIVGILVFGINSCDSRVEAFKRTCVTSGGTLINSGGGSHCIARGAVTSQQ